MSRVVINDEILTAIANAIREKKGTTNGILATNFASEIASIESGGSGGNRLNEYLQGIVTELTQEDLAGISTITAYKFYGDTNLASVDIPNTVGAIYDYAFNGCSNLTSITIGDSVTTIGISAFNVGRKGKSATVYMKSSNPPTIQSNTFSSYVTKYYVPRGSLSAYQNATNWSVYAGKMEEYDVS